MRILSIHSYYQIRGGEDECQEAEVALLRRMGHQTDVYAEDNATVNSLRPLHIALRMLWSQESYRQVHNRLTAQAYDIVHVHNFFPLISPSVYYAARANRVPVVQTLHNYRLLCSSATFFRNGQVCEACLGQAVPWPALIHACYRQDRSATAVVAAMQVMHQGFGTWSNLVDVYITLTQFARDKLIQGGIPAERIYIKPNFVDPDPGVGEGNGGYALFVGRLTVEKGLDTLLSAWQTLGQHLPLKIVGDGPLANQVAAAVRCTPQVHWLGRQPLPEVMALMKNATVLIFPSRWYETFGRVIVEAFATGTPVIAADIGGVTELVKQGQTGLLFRPGDTTDLATQVDHLLSCPQILALMRREARAEYEAKYTASTNYHRLIELYEIAQQQLPKRSDLSNSN